MFEIILLLTGTIAALSTFIANNTLKLGAVKASAGLSFIVALLCLLFDDIFKDDLALQIQLVFFGASFVGMVSKEIISKHYLVGLGGFIFSAIYLNTSYFFEGFGGALGTTACISVIIVFGLRIILNKRKQKANF
ncbi:hypothetical protein [Croceibacter atlanticus]|uniref:hypothetical protein n=1 Tax=Croceibacter atlanticus TaxID=313588 RepID=UPI0030FA327B